MKDVELYAKVRHAVRIEGLSKRAALKMCVLDLVAATASTVMLRRDLCFARGVRAGESQ
jgi:hypothetical protein